MRTAFHQQLDTLIEMLSQMCGLAGLAMERATQGCYGRTWLSRKL